MTSGEHRRSARDDTWDETNEAPTPDDPAALLGTLAGAHRLQSVLGRGGAGIVFEGVHPKTGGVVAVKIVARMPHEVLEASAVAHPNLVRTLDAGTTREGRPYLVMERLVGETLADRLARGRLSLPEAGPIVLQVARGAAALHRAGFLHRDLKPSNVFLAHDFGGPVAKVLDVGLAAAAGEGPGALVGTPRYLAPEVARREPRIDARADVYSLAVILYELVCGRPPFLGEPAGLVALHAIAKADAPTRWAEMSPALERLIVRSLAKHADERPPSMDAFAAELEAILVAEGEIERLPPPPVEPVVADTVVDRKLPAHDEAQAAIPPVRTGGGLQRFVRSLSRVVKLAAGVALTLAVAWLFFAWSSESGVLAESVTVTVFVDPPGANVLVDGPGLVAEGASPLAVPVPRGTRLRIRASARGFAPATVEHGAEVDAEVPIRLEKIERVR